MDKIQEIKTIITTLIKKDLFNSKLQVLFRLVTELEAELSKRGSDG
jgi:hypothetical protein